MDSDGDVRSPNVAILYFFWHNIVHVELQACCTCISWWVSVDLSLELDWLLWWSTSRLSLHHWRKYDLLTKSLLFLRRNYSRPLYESLCNIVLQSIHAFLSTCRLYCTSSVPCDNFKVSYSRCTARGCFRGLCCSTHSDVCNCRFVIQRRLMGHILLQRQNSFLLSSLMDACRRRDWASQH